MSFSIRFMSVDMSVRYRGLVVERRGILVLRMNDLYCLFVLISDSRTLRG